jgi:hypothetical protein
MNGLLYAGCELSNIDITDFLQQRPADSDFQSHWLIINLLHVIPHTNFFHKTHAQVLQILLKLDKENLTPRVVGQFPLSHKLIHHQISLRTAITGLSINPTNLSTDFFRFHTPVVDFPRERSSSSDFHPYWIIIKPSLHKVTDGLCHVTHKPFDRFSWNFLPRQFTISCSLH